MRCQHEYDVDPVRPWGRNRSGDQTVREICRKCGKRREWTDAQHLSLQKRLDRRPRETSR